MDYTRPTGVVRIVPAGIAFHLLKQPLKDLVSQRNSNHVLIEDA